MKHILMVTRPICPPWDEASKNFAFDLAKKIPDHYFHLLTYGTLQNKPANVVEHPIYTSPDLRLSLGQKLRLLRFLAGLPKEIDVMHFLFTPSPITTHLIKKVALSRYANKGNKKIRTIQTIATLNFSTINKSNVNSYLFADRIVTHSDYSRKFLEKLGCHNVERIYPGIDTDKFSQKPRNVELAARLNIKKHELVVLYTGEYVRLKASDLIADALPLLAKKVPDIKLIFACRIKSREDILKKKEIAQKISHNGNDNKVIYLETVEDMVSLYNMADAFIFPAAAMSGKFDIALTVLEAMSTQIPVIINDIPPLNEVAQSPYCAIVKPLTNPDELAKTIALVLRDKEEADKLGRNGRENVRRFFNIDKQAACYAELYAKI